MDKGTTPHWTRNDLSEAVRSRVVALGNALVADAIDLMLQAKQARWNVKGRAFLPLHELFGDIAEETEAHVDTLAERVAQLGGIAVGTLRIVADRSRLGDYPVSIVDGRAHVEAVASSLGAFGVNVRRAITEATGLADAVTADLLTQIARATDRQLWLVEAHVQGSTASDAPRRRGPRAVKRPVVHGAPGERG